MLSDVNSQFFTQIISTQNIIRSKNLVSKLTGMGLVFKISPGVVPTENDYHEGSLHSAFQSRLICQRNLSLGEVGCALAHRRAITSFLNSEHKFGIVFEDDAEIIVDFDFEMITKLLDSDCPVIVALGWIPGFAISRNPQDLIDGEPIELVTSPTCAFAYALNFSAAKLMINNQKRLIDLTDWPIYALMKVKFYAIHSQSPWVTANHDPEFSIIGKRSASISVSPISVFVNRMKLANSLILLLLLSSINLLDASPRQVIHRILIRDMIYKFGKSKFSEKANTSNVIPLSLKYQKVLDRLKLV
jgi:hypothetical protein